MSIVSSIRSLISNSHTPQNWFSELIGGAKTASGVRVNGYTALTVSTVWQAVNVISGDVAQLPLSRYKRTSDDGRERDKDSLIEMRPNRLMTPLKLKETLQSHALIYGNGYAWINRSSQGTPIEIIPLNPTRTSPFFDEKKQLKYKTQVEVRGVQEEKTYQSKNILHISGLGFDGLKGYSVVTLASDSIGMAKAAESHGGNYFKNDATPTGLLSLPGGRPTAESVEETRREWKRQHSGEENSIGILYGGMTFQPLAFTNKDSQFLESREFQRSEIASWFKLPPHKVGDLSRATFGNIEEQNRDYLNMSLMYWLCNWQEECNEKLLSDEQKESGYYYEFNTAALLRGDTASRAAYYSRGILDGWLSRNETRKMENRNSVEGLDDYLVPLNMASNSGLISEDDGSSEDEGGSSEDLENVIEAAVKGIVALEGNNIFQNTKTTKNFCNMLDEYYKKFSAKLWSVIEQLGAKEQTLETYIEQSKEIWLKVADTCTLETLLDGVEKQKTNWNERAKTLSQQIIEDRKQ